jgi:hypothetical protein
MVLINKFNARAFVVGFFALAIFANGCATTPRSKVDKQSKATLETAVNSPKVDVELPPVSTIRLKMSLFEKAIKSGKLNDRDWKIHDELLAYYAELKKRQSTKVIIPSKSKIVIPLETYCLNPDRAVPNSKEVYTWRKSSPGIKYYSELLDLRRRGKIEQDELQGLIWNLKNETRWEEYPNKQKAILQKIDPDASINLPSSLKEKGIDYIKDHVISIPGVGEALDSYELIKGKYYELSDIKKSIEGLTSKYDLEDYDNLFEIPGTGIYSQSESQGYNGQEVTLYNPTDKDQELDLTQYYLEPQRDDVQRIGINPKIPEDPDLIRDLEGLLYESMLRFGIGFTPGVNDVADIYELLTGKDFLTGNSLSTFERSLSGVGVIAGSGQAYRYANRVLNAPSKYVVEFERGIEKVGSKTVGFIGRQEAKTALQTSSHKIVEISNFSELKKAVGFLKKERILGEERREVIKAFKSGTKIRVLDTDEKVFRYWQEGVTSERGHWTTTLNTNNPVRDLALPEAGVYKKSEWIIPKGTEVIDGLIAPNFGKPGGGHQIWLPKPGVLKK